MKIKILIISIIFSILFFQGCISSKNLKYDLRIDEVSKSTIQGKILDTTSSSKDIYLILYKYIKGDKESFSSYKLVDFSMHSKVNKEFSFNITNGRYFIYACQNIEKLRAKKYAYIYKSDYLDIDKATIKINNIKLNQTAVEVEDENILISSLTETSLFENFGGLIHTSINDTIFSRKNSSTGLWNPENFLKDVGGGIYLLDKYQKNKKVILFVHGMSGTPIDFKYIIDNLDKTKYYPIVYYYPTGINLNYAVDGLKYSFDKLQKLYDIKDITIVAHSMGGLVSRAFINNSGNIKINKFISISTPWNGQKYAQLGGDSIKNIVASFGNMIPKSAFIQNNQNIKFPNYLKHYLLFTYKGKSSFVLDASNDGVISLSSQLYEKAEQKAHIVYGFNENHTSVLRSDTALSFIQKIIKD